MILGREESLPPAPAEDEEGGATVPADIAERVAAVELQGNFMFDSVRGHCAACCPASASACRHGRLPALTRSVWCVGEPQRLSGCLSGHGPRALQSRRHHRPGESVLLIRDWRAAVGQVPADSTSLQLMGGRV